MASPPHFSEATLHIFQKQHYTLLQCGDWETFRTVTPENWHVILHRADKLLCVATVQLCTWFCKVGTLIIYFTDLSD
jgi:hypothetical protein